MPLRRETPHPSLDQVVAGHFVRRGRYRAWREHGTRDWLLIYTAGGRGRFGFDGGEIITTAGDAVLLRPGARHDYGLAAPDKPWELLWAHFHPRPSWIDWLAWPEHAPGAMRIEVRDVAARRQIRHRLADVVALAASSLRRRQEFAMNALEEVLLRFDALNPRGVDAAIDPRIRAAADHACRHLDRRITLDDLADVAGLSHSRFAHLFRQQTGSTPQQFLEHQRLARARQLLSATPLSVKEVAHQVGFDNPFYFTLRFRRATGTSPRQWRERDSRRQR
jgi:AraC family transcriptional regulator of arabinose operon